MKKITNDTHITRSVNGGFRPMPFVWWLWKKIPKVYENVCKPTPKVSKW